MVTDKQREVAERLVEGIKDMDLDVVRDNIRKENEYMAKKRKAQKPTREQMQRRFNI